MVSSLWNSRNLLSRLSSQCSRNPPTKMFLVQLYIWYLILGFSESVRLVELMVPSQVMVGSRAVLHCLYDMEGEELYSVKFYKAGQEFFRYIPGDRDQRITTFNLPGVKVDRSYSDSTKVTLREINLSSTGRYRCEVSAEAPLFNTVSQSKRLQAIALPKAKPRISGGNRGYHVGDRVKVNCTSAKSQPASELRWYINGKPAAVHNLRHYPTLQHETGLETAILGLEFQVFPTHLSGTKLDLDLRCTSTLTALVTQPDSRIEEHHHQEMVRHRSFGSLIPARSSALYPGLPLVILNIFIILYQFLLRFEKHNPS